jgi:hypothetical protein
LALRLDCNFITVCLLLLYSPKRIFGFVQITRKKTANACLAWLPLRPLWRRVRLASMFVTVILPHHFIHLGILFRFEWRVCGGSA